MRLFKKKDRNPKLALAKDKLLDELTNYDPQDKEYQAILESLKAIIELELRTNKWLSKVDANTFALIVCNLLGILIIVAYEQKHVFASKASGFLAKVR
jgi:hypothetical protein